MIYFELSRVRVFVMIFSFDAPVPPRTR